jgi:hypothetical protein
MVADTDFIKTWKLWIEAFIINDIKKALDKDALEVGLIILTLLGTECLSAYYSGKRDSDIATFEKYVKKYFPPVYTPYANTIYRSLRNGLAHSYIPAQIKIGSSEITPFVMVRDLGEPHLSPLQAGRQYPVIFNRAQFAQDFIAAWEKYSRDVDATPQLQRNVAARAQKGMLVVDEIKNFIDSGR